MNGKPAMHGCRAIAAALAAHKGSMQSFMRSLDRERVPYLSYSKINSVEFCPYRYYLEYVAGVRLRPEPSYFAKGRTFHEAADRFYRAMARGAKLEPDALEPLIRRHRDEEDQRHLKNAVRLLVENAMTGWEVAAIEEPFVLSLGRRLPPCIGVVDLVLRKGDLVAVIDHKTGRNFGNTDELQMAIYCQHALAKHKARECLTFFDEYRWVNDLGRIRKPAFQRTPAHLNPNAWALTLRRFAAGYQRIRRVEEERNAPGTDECYKCPFHLRCDKAFSWW